MSQDAVLWKSAQPVLLQMSPELHSEKHHMPAHTFLVHMHVSVIMLLLAENVWALALSVCLDVAYGGDVLKIRVHDALGIKGCKQTILLTLARMYHVGSAARISGHKYWVLLPGNFRAAPL